MTALAFDTETWLIGPGKVAPRMVCGSFAERVGSALVGTLLKPAEALDKLRAALTEGRTIIGHNLAFDVLVTVQAAPDLLPLWVAAAWQNRLRDTGIRQRLLDLAVGCLDRGHKYTLADLVKRHLGEDISESKGPDSWRLRYSELDPLPLEDWPRAARIYPVDDARHTYQVWQAQGLDRLNNEPEQIRAALALAWTSARGLLVDRDAVARQRAALQAKLKEVFPWSRANGSTDTKALAAAITRAFNGKPPETEKGSVSRSGETLQASGDPELMRYARTLQAQTYLRTLIPALSTPSVHCRYNVVKGSGRTSSSGPNVQNLPRRGGWRECFRPRPGMVFVACDYSQLELCTLAQVCLEWFGESAMADAINEGQDLHLVLAGKLLGRPAKRPEDDSARQFAKIGNYGYAGGMGPETLLTNMREQVYRGDLPEEFAAKDIEDTRSLRNAWFECWPEMGPYFRKVNDSSVIVQLVSERVRRGADFCARANSYFQGLAADGALLSLWRVFESCVCRGTSLWGSHPVAFIHDEILLECPIERVTDAALAVQDIMVSSMRRYCPDVRIEAEPVAMHRWSKRAKPIWQDGELLPYAEVKL